MNNPQTAALDILSWRFFRISFTTLLIIFVIAGAVIQAHQANDYSIVFYKLGSIVVLSTNHAASDATQIINSQTPTGFWNYVFFYSDFILSVWLIFTFINLIAKGLGYSPVSNPNNVFGNYILAIVLYFIIQSVLILGVAALYKQVNSTGDMIAYLSRPFKSVGLIYEAILRVISPVTSNLDKYTNSSINPDSLPELLK